MRKILIYAFIIVAGFASCSKDDNSGESGVDFVVAFESPSTGFDTDETSKNINLTFSTPATSDGSIVISFTAQNAVYGEDFTTTPSASDSKITLPIASGMGQTSFEFKKLQNPSEGEEAVITFEITSVNHPDGYTQGNTSTVVSLTDTASLGGQFNPEVGGHNQPNQVYVDLSAQKETAIRRDSWDLSFYGGDSFRVGINGSVYMATAQLNTTDINTVNESQVEELMGLVAVGTFDPSNMNYIDHPGGDINQTAISPISENDNDNKVYLVNLGYEVSTDTPEPGSVAIAGDHRGWKKIRILRSGNDYLLQYANLNDTSYQTAIISKNPEYNFTFFSFTNNTVNVEPKKEKWDLNFTVFTDEIEGYGSYGYADFVAANRKAGVTGYMVEGNTEAFNNFTSSQIQPNLFEIDQRFIGSNWRVGGGPNTQPGIKDNVFFIIKDPDENIYKLRFTALLNENGIRGYPAFEYVLLNE